MNCILYLHSIFLIFIRWTLKTVCLIFNFSIVCAQNPLEIIINVNEPYPVELDYYSANRGNVFITVNNVTGIEQQIYYHVRLISNNGLDAQTYTFVKPMEPVIIEPYQTIVYTGDDIGRDFPFKYPEDVQISSVTPEQLQYMEFQRALPEGTYVLCVTARDFLTDIPLTFDCSNEFSIYYGDAPQIIEPYNGEVVPANAFSNISIIWRPPFSVTPSAGTFVYELKMIDITNDGFGDYENLFSNPGVYPELHVDNLQENIYIYQDIDNLPLQPGHRYALRVKAEDNFNTFPLTNNGFSEVSTFWYGYNPNDGTGILDSANQEEENPCIQNCYFSMNDINTNPISNAGGLQRLKIGHFDITDLIITNTPGQAVNGTGIIQIPWLNDVKVNVEFQNLSVNSAGRIYEGIVSAVIDQHYDPSNINRGIAEEMNGFIRNGRIIGAIGGGASMGMPLGFVQNVMGYNLMAGFTKMEFRPDRASCQLMYNMHIPAFGEHGWISMAGTDICLTSGGFAQEFMLHPVQAYNIPFMDDISFRISGHHSDDPNVVRQGATFMEVDCNGIKGFGIKVEIDFPRDVLVPDENDGSTGDGLVKGSFFFSIDRTRDANENVYVQANIQRLPEEAGIHFVASLNIDPFQVNGIRGWGFNVDDAWLDCSDVANPPNMVWPQNYDDPNIAYNSGSQRMELQNTWKGIYIRRAQLKSPDNFLGVTGRKAISVNHMIIDPTFSATIAVTNYINKGESDIDGWSLSLDSLFLTIVQNNLQSGGFSGELGMPITDQGQYFRYTAIISDSDPNNNQRDPLSYSFSINPSDDIHFPFMMARASLSSNSYVLGRFTPGQAHNTYFETFLQGGVGISSELFQPEDGSTNLPLYLPVVDFSFNYHSKNGFTNSHLGFTGCNDCGNIANNIENDYDFSYGLQFSEERFVGFPLNIEKVAFKNSSANAPILTITPRVSLATGQGGIAGSVGIDFISELKTVRGERKLKFQRLGVSSLSIQQNAVYGLTLEGEVEFYNSINQNNVGNQGARGMLQVLIPALPGIRLAAEFGTEVTDPRAPIGTASNYDYWYLDGMFYFGDAAGVTIGPGLGLYGLGGGIFVNMSRGAYTGMNQQEVDQMLALAIQTGADTRPTGTLPTKSFGSYGMKFAATLGTMPLPFALNMDVSLYAQFSKNQGINMVSIEGAAYALAPLTARGQTPVWADASIVWEKLKDGVNVFDGTFNLYVNLFGIIEGRGKNKRMVGANFHVETGNNGKWWFHAGSPDNRGGLKFGIPNLPTPTVNADGYFMLGYNLPAELPIPERVAFLLHNPQTGSGKNRLDNSNTVNNKPIERTDIEKLMAAQASGIAFGAELSVGVDINAFILYATLDAYLGFDVNITRAEGRTCYTGSGDIAPGINNWYATGQVYAGLEGDMGVQVKFAGKRHRLSIFRMGAALMLRGGGPNPIWVEGRAGVYYSVLGGVKEGKATFDVTVGQKCVPAMGNPFGDLEIIYETLPQNGETGVTTFADPTATFILPINQRFDLPSYDANGDPKTLSVELELNRHNVTKESDEAIIPIKEVKWSNDKSSATIKLQDKLNERTWYVAEFRVIAWEYQTTASVIPGQGISTSENKIRLKDENNQNWYEERIVRFRTGTDPYPIPEDQVVKTVPIRKQRYFMRNEMAIKTLEVNFDRNMKDGYFPDSNDKFEYEYYFRLEPVRSNADAIILPLTNPQTVDFIRFAPIPELLTSTIYSIQLVRKQKRKIGSVNLNLREGQVVTEGPGGVMTFSDISITGYNDVAQEMSTSDTIRRKATVDPGQRQNAGESIIYQYYFRTSAYETMQEKLNAMTISHERYYAPAGQMDGLHIKLSGIEGFDIFDIRGESDNNGNITVAPRLHVRVDEPNLVWPLTGEKAFFTKIRTGINPFLDTYNSISGLASITYYHTNPTAYFPVTRIQTKPPLSFGLNLPYDANPMSIEINQEVTGFRNKLTDLEINLGIASENNLLPGNTERLRIDYNLFDKAYYNALDLRNFALDMRSEQINISFQPVNNPSPTAKVNQLKYKWRDYLDANFPDFTTRTISLTQLTGLQLGQNRGEYKVKIESQRQYHYQFQNLGGYLKNITINY